jgi:phosphoribosylanthranilate isomerase
MVRVKICGITRIEDIESAVSSDADAVGFIVGFPTSPRNLTLERAEGLIDHVPTFVDAVLVTNVETLTNEFERIKTIRPDAIQLYGEISRIKNMLSKIDSSIIKALRVNSQTSFVKGQFNGFDAVLTDSYSKEQYGGTGRVADWNISSRIREAIAPKPLILSGGLNTKNVVQAIIRVKPYAVDASSGVEKSPGIKDAHKVREFVRNAKGV